MKPTTLVGQLLGWQVVVTAAACTLLVGGTMLAGRLIIQRGQDSTLSALADTLCVGIQHERAEKYPEYDTKTAAAHFFVESNLAGHHFELWHRDGTLVMDQGDLPDLPIDGLEHGEDSGCRSLVSPTERRNGEGPLRECRRPCEGKYVVRIVTADALHTREVRSAALALLFALPVALAVGVLVGRVILRRILRPVAELRDAAASARIGPTMSLDVGAQPAELAELERGFDRLLNRLAVMLDREKRFAHDASHELRTPLTNLRLRLERILRHAPGDSEQTEQLEAALRDIDLLDRLTESLLALGRPESAELPVAPVNLCDLAREAAAEDPTPVAVEAPDEVLVRGNEELLIRAMSNVLENARKYAGAEARIRLRIHVENGCGVIEIEDDGPGIPPKTRQYVFDRFYRGPAQRSAVPGVGLGLSVVEAIARRHGGDIDTGPSELGGERVRIRIPLNREAE